MIDLTEGFLDIPPLFADQGETTRRLGHKNAPHPHPNHFMITGELKSKVDRIWDAMWSGGVSNPLSVIEQLTIRVNLSRKPLFTVCRLARSAANYQMIASRVSVARCVDPAFLRLREQLQIWFPQDLP